MIVPSQAPTDQPISNSSVKTHAPNLRQRPASDVPGIAARRLAKYAPMIRQAKGVPVQGHGAHLGE